MFVKLTRDMKCTPDEQAPKAVQFRTGDIVTGWPATVAKRNGWGVEVDADAAVVTVPPSTPAGNQPASTGEQAPGSGSSAPHSAGGEDPPPAQEAAPAPELTAIVKRRCEFEIDGEMAKLARGARLTGEDARRAIDAGIATEIAAPVTIDDQE